MTRPVPPWGDTKTCPHPTQDSRIAGPRDCAWCGKPAAWGLIGRVDIPHPLVEPDPWWHIWMLRLVGVGPRAGPAIWDFAWKFGLSWILQWLLE